MTRISLRLSLSLILLFTAVLSLIRAQPYDDRELRALLLPEGCPAPCFMGIRPGVTTVEEAVKILEASGWVMEVKIVIDNARKLVTITWDWNGKQSTILDQNLIASLNGYISTNVMATIVANIIVPTSIPFGVIYLTLGGGSDDTNYLNYLKWQEPRPSYVGGSYRSRKLYVYGFIQGCPVTIQSFWKTLVTVIIGDNFLVPSADLYCLNEV